MQHVSFLFLIICTKEGVEGGKACPQAKTLIPYTNLPVNQPKNL